METDELIETTEKELPIKEQKKVSFKDRKITLTRRAVQLFVFIFLNSVFWAGIFPFDLTVFENIFKYVPFISSPRSEFSNSTGLLELMLGSLTQRIAPFLVFGLIIIIATIFGRAACGWLCPAGLLQDFFAWIGQTQNKTRKIGLKPHGYMVKLKSYILGILLLFFIPFLFMANVDYSIYKTYTELLADFGRNPLSFWSFDEFFSVFLPDLWTKALEGGLEAIFSNIITFIQLILYLIFIFVGAYYPRFYCRYLCPYAALVKPISKNSIIVLARNPAKCVGRRKCGECEKKCPMQIRILDNPYNRITGNGECILCGKCKEVCRYDAMGLSFF
ncbi:MAG: 4Fe-4S binding protein [Candidatus Hodarchaeota archaeon]